MQSILTTAFLDFGQYCLNIGHFLIDIIVESKFVIPPINTSSITNVTTLDELKTLVTDTYWTPLNAMCGADCGPTKVKPLFFKYNSMIMNIFSKNFNQKDEFLTEMETGWGEGLEEVLAIKTLFTTTANSMKAEVEKDFRYKLLLSLIT